MTPAPPLARRERLSVDVDLTLRDDKGEVRVFGSGDRIAASIDRVGTAVRLLRSWRDVAAVIESIGLTVDVRIADRTVGSVGRAARPSRLARRLTGVPVEIRKRALLATILRRRAWL